MMAEAINYFYNDTETISKVSHKSIEKTEQEKIKPPKIKGEQIKLSLKPSEKRKEVFNKAKQYVTDNSSDEKLQAVSNETSQYLYEPIGQERDVFILDKSAKNLVPRYDDFEPIVESEPVCQDLTWSCYNYSGAIMYEAMIRETNPANSVTIDRNYVNYCVYKNQLQRMLDELDAGQLKSQFVDDGSCASFYRAIDRRGVIPAGVWQCPVEQHGGFSRDMTVYLQQETEKILNDKLSSNEDKISRIITLIEELTNYYGNPPETFSYEEKTYTPQTFKTFLGVGKEQFVSLVNSGNKEYGTVVDNNRFSREDHQTHDEINLNVPMSELRSLMRKSIEEGLPFEVGLDVSEPGVRCMFDEQDEEAKSLIVGDWPKGYEFTFETEDLRQQYSIRLGQLQKKSLDEMSEDDKEELRTIRRAIGDITPNHVITIVGMKKMKGRVFYLAHDSALGASGYGQKRILSEEYILQNNVGINFVRSFVERNLSGTNFEKINDAKF